MKIFYLSLQELFHSLQILEFMISRHRKTAGPTKPLHFHKASFDDTQIQHPNELIHQNRRKKCDLLEDRNLRTGLKQLHMARDDMVYTIVTCSDKGHERVFE